MNSADRERCPLLSANMMDPVGEVPRPKRDYPTPPPSQGGDAVPARPRRCDLKGVRVRRWQWRRQLRQWRRLC